MASLLIALLIYPEAKDLQVVHVVRAAFPEGYDVIQFEAMGVQDKALTLRARWVLCPDGESS